MNTYCNSKKSTARSHLNDKGQINRCYCSEGFIGARRTQISRERWRQWLHLSFFINNQKFKQSPRKSHAFKPISTDVLCWRFAEKWPTRGCSFHWPITYEEEDIMKFWDAIPKLKPMKGIMKLHKIEYILQQQEVNSKKSP